MGAASARETSKAETAVARAKGFISAGFRRGEYVASLGRQWRFSDNMNLCHSDAGDISPIMFQIPRENQRKPCHSRVPEPRSYK